MENVFAGRMVYGGNWNVVNTRPFTQEEIGAVKRAEVVSSEYGNSCCFFMRGGGMTYIPMSRDCSLVPGDSVDLSKAKILTLSKEGKRDITRIDI